MSPRSESLSHYFSLAVDLFHEYKWAYDFKATDILSDDVMRGVPLQFQEFFKGFHETDGQFHELLNLQENNGWPSNVRKFVADCKHLISLSRSLKYSNCTDYSHCLEESTIMEGKLKLPKKWNPKKYLEVAHVGNFVGRIASREGCDAVVDLGSGLGYLSSHLASQFRIPVIGLESEASRVLTAQSNHNHGEGSSGSVSQTYACLRITENISEEIGSFTSNFSHVCLTALHACGDLSPWSLKHFVSNETCKMVAVVPCCYHKMLKEASNFPMSQGLHSALSRYDDISFLRSQWLWRLAGQRAGAKFLNDIRRETRNLFYRALLERFLLKEGLQLKRLKRNAYDSEYHGFPEYLQNTVGDLGAFGLSKDSELVGEEEMKSVIYRMTELHDELYSWSRIITGVLALQGAIQLIAEELILLDRLSFMEESGLVKAAGVIRVIPESVSPRGMVLFGIKK